MTIPVWILFAFAVWTLLVLISTIGVYRWSRVLTGRANMASYANYEDYKTEKHDWYKRAMRAHANCVENLPVYGALVVVLYIAGLDQPALDILALILFGARILHTSVHVFFEQTNFVVGFRSLFMIIQLFCMLGIAGVIAANFL